MINNLHEIYNKDFVEYIQDEVVIKEHDTGARVDSIKVKNAKFYSFNKDILDRTNEIFKSNSGKIRLTKGCDGILLFQIEKQWYLFLIELKSGFSATNIEKATVQLQITYSKLSMILNIIEGIVELKDCQLRGFIIAEKPNSEQKVKISKKADTFNGYCIEKLCKKMIVGIDICIEKDNSILSKLPLKDKYKFEKMHLFYIPSDQTEIDITSFL